MKKRTLISTFIILAFSLFLVEFIKVTGANAKLKTINPSWGLGTNVTEAVSNDRDYDWYVDQFNTGKSNYMNCGPATIEMAMKWLNKDSSITAEKIRNKYLPDESSGMWDFQITDCLTDNHVTNRSLNDVTEDNFKNELKSGNILIVQMNMKYITYNMVNEERVGKYVNENYTHYMVIKGFKVVDNKLYFETYDPYSWNIRYIDRTLIGKDRYYLAKDLVTATIASSSSPTVVENNKYHHKFL